MPFFLSHINTVITPLLHQLLNSVAGDESIIDHRKLEEIEEMKCYDTLMTKVAGSFAGAAALTALYHIPYG